MADYVNKPGKENEIGNKSDSNGQNVCDESVNTVLKERQLGGLMFDQTYGNEITYKNVHEYAQAVHCWLWNYRMAAAFSTFHCQIMASAQNSFFCQKSDGQASSGSVPSGLSTQSVPAGTSDTLGVQYKIPVLWKRVVAEFLDFVLLFYIKVLITVAALRQMGYMNEEVIDLDANFPFISEIGDFDYEKMFSITSELIALEVVNRLCITIVETMCLRQGYAGIIGGSTPGKKIMQLKVISFSDIRDARNGHIIVTGVKDPGLFNALIRSVIKNFSMAFFFPACLSVFLFRFNRTAYDILSQTVVVEAENRPQHVQ